jgi:hypothetical protein
MMSAAIKEVVDAMALDDWTVHRKSCCMSLHQILAYPAAGACCTDANTTSTRLFLSSLLRGPHMDIYQFTCMTHPDIHAEFMKEKFTVKNSKAFILC